MHRSYNFCVKTSLRLLLQHDYLKLFRVRVDLTNLSKQCKSQKAEIVFCVENAFIRFKRQRETERERERDTERHRETERQRDRERNIT